MLTPSLPSPSPARCSIITTVPNLATVLRPRLRPEPVLCSPAPHQFSLSPSTHFTSAGVGISTPLLHRRQKPRSRRRQICNLINYSNSSPCSIRAGDPPLSPLLASSATPRRLETVLCPRPASAQPLRPCKPSAPAPTRPCHCLHRGLYSMAFLCRRDSCSPHSRDAFTVPSSLSPSPPSIPSRNSKPRPPLCRPISLLLCPRFTIGGSTGVDLFEEFLHIVGASSLKAPSSPSEKGLEKSKSRASFEQGPCC
ncbi:hypothetical protein M0R45_006168 [Rubus argutus]|uniref:Uncharacterized protein n=1 Tax=Rubus argutus TaxID=59490 RepID=A0AAW1YQ93_RUBAR